VSHTAVRWKLLDEAEEIFQIQTFNNT